MVDGTSNLSGQNWPSGSKKKIKNKVVLSFVFYRGASLLGTKGIAISNKSHDCYCSNKKLLGANAKGITSGIVVSLDL